MVSDVLFKVLPDFVLVWLHFLSGEFWELLLILIVISIIINVFIIFSPHFLIGFSEIKEKIFVTRQLSLNSKDINDSFKFIYAYARNPNIFSSKQNVTNLIEALDDKLKSLPDINVAAENQEGFELGSTTDSNKIGISKGLKSRKLKVKPWVWKFFNTLVLGFIIVFNIVVCYKYNSLLDEYFDKGTKGYVLNTDKLKKIEDPKTLEKVRRLSNYIEVINEKKYRQKSK